MDFKIYIYIFKRQGLKLLALNSPPTSASQTVEITGMSTTPGPKVLMFVEWIGRCSSLTLTSFLQRSPSGGG